MAKLTKAQRTRLDKLAAYLEGLPADYEHFDMVTYVVADDEGATIRYAQYNGGVSSCGTVACAVGHGPAAGILMPPRFLKLMSPRRPIANMVAWAKYSSLFIGEGGAGGYSHSRRFAWLFGSPWSRHDNHHFGAAARIRYMLANGEPPEDFDDYPERAHLTLYAPYRIDAPVPA